MDNRPESTSRGEEGEDRHGEELVGVTEEAKCGNIGDSELRTLPSIDESFLRFRLRAGYALLNENSLPEDFQNIKIPIRDIGDLFPKVDKGISELQKLLTGFLNSAFDPFLIYLLSALMDVVQKCILRYYENRNDLMRRYNKYFISQQKYSLWLGYLSQLLLTLEDIDVFSYMDTDEDMVYSQVIRPEDYTGRSPIVCKGAAGIKLTERRGRCLNMSMDELIVEDARNNVMVEQKIEIIKAYLSRFDDDADYFITLRNYLDHYHPLYDDVTRVIRNHEIQNMSEEEFNNLKSNYVEYLAAILLLHDYIESSKKEEEEKLEEDEYVDEEDEEEEEAEEMEEDDDEEEEEEEEEEEVEEKEEWEPMPLDSEGEEELHPAPAIQDTNLWIKQLSQQDIKELRGDHQCSICKEKSIANENPLQCPGCGQYHHEQCLLSHLQRHSELVIVLCVDMDS